MLLSIIIPAYNAEPYIESLINALKPQITDEVEVIVIDDGSKTPYLPPYKWIHVERFEDNLSVGTPVIVTPLDVLDEIGVVDGENARVLPYELSEHTNLKNLQDIPMFSYKYNNNPLIQKWKSVLGKTKPTNTYRPPEKVTIKIIREYQSIQINRLVKIGEVLTVNRQRADVLINAGYAVKEE